MKKQTPKHTQVARKLRQSMTEAEKKFWFQVRNRRFENLKFKREHSIPPYVVDFYCDVHKLIIEIDGGQHNESEKDKERDADLESRGFSVLRFWNNDILNNIEGVMESISLFLKSPHPSKAVPLPPSPEREGKDNQLHIGTIRGAHGVKGLVRVAVYADDLSLFDEMITLKNKHKGDVWLAQIQGVNNKEDADALKGTKIYCDRKDLSEPNADEIYHADLIGMECVTEDGEFIGTVQSVENFGAGDIFDIKPPKGESFYLSYDENTVIKIDNKITVRLPEII